MSEEAKTEGQGTPEAPSAPPETDVIAPAEGKEVLDTPESPKAAEAFATGVFVAPANAPLNVKLNMKKPYKLIKGLDQDIFIQGGYKFIGGKCVGSATKEENPSGI